MLTTHRTSQHENISITTGLSVPPVSIPKQRKALGRDRLRLHQVAAQHQADLGVLRGEYTTRPYQIGKVQVRFVMTRLASFGDSVAGDLEFFVFKILCFTFSIAERFFQGGD
jgi:hypothetical protein